jgi:D-3-phosphoglycerate dehydrogenase / 2-oxoglutarate reductase
MKIAVLNDYQRAVETLECYAKLAKAHAITVFDDAEADEAKLGAKLAPYEAIVLIRERTRITRSLLERLPNLKLIVQTGKVAPHLDLAACKARGVVVSDSGGSPVAPAELTWLLMLAALREFVPEVEAARAGKWQRHLGEAIAGKKLGLVGYGKIAQRVARYAKAFDVELHVWGRQTTLQRAQEAGLPTTDSLLALCAACDIVSLHLRLNDATRGIVKREHLAAMKPTALLVNTSRAELVQAGALEAALAAGRPGRAALDVFEAEPVFDRNHPLIGNARVLPTPHIGFVERATYERYLGDAFEAVEAFSRGAPVRVVE